MVFVDDITLKVCSGKGGDGVVRWSSIRGKALGGPAGGNGGKGGDVFIRGVRDVSILRSYRHSPNLFAKSGGDGGGESQHGKDGMDLIIDVPVGSLVSVAHVRSTKDTSEQGDGEFVPKPTLSKKETLHKNIDQHDNSADVSLFATYEVLEEGTLVRILPGGRGGLGNEHFKSSINRSPRKVTKGAEGLCANIYIELRLIADVGLVGSPNSGKSTLLNSLTSAGAKVGDYPFTTLTPNLGVFKGKVIADIPGLIEGASQGKGLGHTFLRHVTRVKSLIFCISAERDNPMEEFLMLEKEMETFNKELLQKPKIILFTKTDLFDKKDLESKMKPFIKKDMRALAISSFTGDGLPELRDFIVSVA